MFKKVSLLLILFILGNISMGTKPSQMSIPTSYTLEIPLDAKIIINGALGFAATYLCVLGGKRLYTKFYTPKPQPKAQIGIIEINDLSNAPHHLSLIEKVRFDQNIKGVILKVNSGGGPAGTSETIFRELKILQQHKPIIVYVENVCCSGAYLIACTGKIITPQMAEVGSIGVLCAIEKIKDPKTNKRENLTIDFIFAGADKVFKNPYSAEASPEQRKKVQDQVDLDYDFFCSAVAQERNLSLTTKEKWANAQTFVGPDALELGLIDKIGGFSDAKDYARDLVKEKLEDKNTQINFIEIK
ncbi:S49 family peptidase [bacterium]|jgi:protease IV|nr:S49 family peptidase [bacterium]MBT5015605.1 S49 family peptidase [bacterium]